MSEAKQTTPGRMTQQRLADIKSSQSRCPIDCESQTDTFMRELIAEVERQSSEVTRAQVDLSTLPIDELYDWKHQQMDRFHDAIESRFREGQLITYARGEHEVSVRVLRVHQDQLYVLNPHTGKEYHIYAFSVVAS